MDLVCPAGTLPALRAAVDAGASWVYFGLRDDTNARNFAGLNFTREDAAAGVRYARSRRARTLLAINTYPQAGTGDRWKSAVDTAAELGIDAVILADPALMAYASRTHRKLELHLSVQASATNYEAINFYRERFGIKRAVLPRVLSVAQVENVIRHTAVEIEVFGFGSLCVMVEGRCMLSSYVTGASPNTFGACSPGAYVRWNETRQGLESRLNGVLVNRYAPHENAAYPTLCKGRYDVAGQRYCAMEEPASLNAMDLLPALARMGVAGIKIEGRQRNAAYVSQVTRIWRAAIDAALRRADRFSPATEWQIALRELSEGQQQTLGAYHRPWK